MLGGCLRVFIDTRLCLIHIGEWASWVGLHLEIYENVLRQVLQSFQSCFILAIGTPSVLNGSVFFCLVRFKVRKLINLKKESGATIVNLTTPHILWCITPSKAHILKRYSTNKSIQRIDIFLMSLLCYAFVVGFKDMLLNL